MGRSPGVRSRHEARGAADRAAVAMSDPSKTDPSPIPSVTAMNPRLDAIGLVVSDMARSLAFYRRLGVAVPDATDGPHAEAELGGGIRMMWDTEEVIRGMDPSWTRPTGHAIALAVGCARPAEVDSLHGALVADGTVSRLDPYDAPWGQRYAQVADPDGNVVDLYAPLA